MVQQLGTTRDTTELRGQCRCQIDVIGELRGKIQTEASAVSCDFVFHVFSMLRVDACAQCDVVLVAGTLLR